MWISNFAIKNSVVTTVVMLALVLFGTVALLVLDTDEFPEIEPPIVNVQIQYPGASPENVERELVEPLEESFVSITGVDEIRSRALDGHAVITIEFLFEKDLNEATQDVRDKISEVRFDLPAEMEEPVVRRFDPDDLPIVSLTLSSEKVPPEMLTRIADPGITSELRSIAGVADVRIVGGIERELVVELRPRDMRAANVSVQQIAEAVSSQNLAAPVGSVKTEQEETSIRLLGRLATPRDFERIPVLDSDGAIVRLGTVANVRDGTEEPRSLALFNGKPAVGIDVLKSQGYSTTRVSEAVLERVRAMEAELPESVGLDVVRNSGTRVERSVEDVQRSLLEGALLTVLVVFLFLRSWRSTVITGLALPVSVLSSFIAVWALDFTLNTMSLLGLSLAIGILVDDAIVVRENIVRHMEMGKDHVTAAREGTAEIGLAVAATTLSIVVVFVPVAFMGGVAEQWFAPFALTIASSVMVSLLVSFSLDPMLSAHWPDPEVEGGRKTFLTHKLARFNAWFDRQTGFYRRVIRWALGHRVITGLIAVVTFLAALAMPATGLIGGEFLPAQDRSEFTILLETPPGSSLEYTRSIARRAGAIAREHPAVDYTYATIGGETEIVDEASVYVRLLARAERKAAQDEVARVLRDRIRSLGTADVAIATRTFGAEKAIQLEVSGPDLDVLGRLAGHIAREVEKVPGAVDVGLSTKGDRPELEVEVDREFASQMNLNVASIAQYLRTAFAGIDAGDWVDPSGETRDVWIRLASEARRDAADVRDLPLMVAGTDGVPKVVPLSHVARVERGVAPAQIEHLDRRRVITVGANTEGRSLNAVVQDIQSRVASVVRRPGYTVSQGGDTEDQQEVFGRILVALGIAILLMYFVLVIQFRSFLDPVAILASLPLSLIGVMLALFVTGTTLNLMSMIGVILLVGIVAKNAILLIDFAKWSEERGMNREDAIVEAGAVRLRPILMTSFAIVAGMLPVAIGAGEGADFRAPLGRAVIGGVVTSTILTLLVIPTFYDALTRFRDRLLARLRPHRGSRGSEPSRRLDHGLHPSKR